MSNWVTIITHYTFCLPSLILRKTSIFSLVLQKLKSSFIMLSGGDIGIYNLQDPNIFFPQVVSIHLDKH